MGSKVMRIFLVYILILTAVNNKQTMRFSAKDTCPNMNSDSELEPLESTPFSDTFSESDLDEDPDGYLGSHQRALSLLAEAMVALIVRLWIATLAVSTLMYFLRRIPVHPVVHHTGAYMSDKEILITTPSLQAETTPALFGMILTKSLSGI
jgi:hypothetical protein